jgi:hypothetical protein
MCRNIKPLHNLAPPATPEEIHAASVQFVRKVTGSTKPSQANADAAERAAAQIAQITADLLDGWVTPATPRTRESDAAQARARWERRVARAEAGSLR